MASDQILEPGRDGWWRIGTDPVASAMVITGFIALLAPVLWDLGVRPWPLQFMDREVAMLAAAAWLLYRKRHLLAALPQPTSRGLALVGLALALFVYVVGRRLQVLTVEMSALVLVEGALLALFCGARGLRVAWSPLCFAMFAVPIPFVVEAAVSQPLRLAVAVASAKVLSWANYPTAQEGFVITIGQYDLLVADACAGVQTMVTLEAMALLYASYRHEYAIRLNLALATLVVPIALIANTMRVVLIMLITYYLGDAVGRGFMHHVAGNTLFVVALAAIIGVDSLLLRAIPLPQIRR